MKRTETYLFAVLLALTALSLSDRGASADPSNAARQRAEAARLQRAERLAAIHAVQQQAAQNRARLKQSNRQVGEHGRSAPTVQAMGLDGLETRYVGGKTKSKGRGRRGQTPRRTDGK